MGCFGLGGVKGLVGGICVCRVGECAPLFFSASCPSFVSMRMSGGYGLGYPRYTIKGGLAGAGEGSLSVSACGAILRRVKSGLVATVFCFRKRPLLGESVSLCVERTGGCGVFARASAGKRVAGSAVLGGLISSKLSGVVMSVSNAARRACRGCEGKKGLDGAVRFVRGLGGVGGRGGDGLPLVRARVVMFERGRGRVGSFGGGDGR